MNYGLTRRDFLGGMTAAAGLSLAGCASSGVSVSLGGGTSRRYAAQLYSVHKIVWETPAVSFNAIKAAGYAGVEFAGYGGHGAKELKQMLEDAELLAMGSHVNGPVELTGDNLAKTLDFAAELGLASITTPHAKCDSADGYRKFGAAMGAAAEKAKAYGIKVGVHTTHHHFTTKYGAETAWDMIFKDASQLLQQQIDTCNSFHVGADPAALIRARPGRNFSVHLKENTPSASAVIGIAPTDGGAMVPWADVLAASAADRVEWYVVEAEAIPDSFTPLARSLVNLERM